MTGMRFILDRIVDVTKVSGTGIVAEGFEASDGTVFLRWLSDTPSSVIYDDIRHVELVHGHNGASLIRFLDQPDEPAPVEPPPSNEHPLETFDREDRG